MAYSALNNPSSPMTASTSSTTMSSSPAATDPQLRHVRKYRRATPTTNDYVQTESDSSVLAAQFPTFNISSPPPNCAASTSTMLSPTNPSASVPSKKPRTTPAKNRDPVMKIAVECGSHKGTMHLDRFRGPKCKAQFIELSDGSGSGPSRWITPKKFADMDGKKEWKHYVKHGKLSLRKLEKLGYLKLEMKEKSTCYGCICPDCCPGRRHVGKLTKKKKLNSKPQVKKDRTTKLSSSKSPVVCNKMDDQVLASEAVDAARLIIAQSQSKKLEDDSKIVQRSSSVDTAPQGGVTAPSLTAVFTRSASSPLASSVNIQASTSSTETEAGARSPKSCKMVGSRPVLSCQPVARVVPKCEAPSSDFAVYFTSARGLDARLRCHVTKAFPDIVDILRWPNEQFLIYRKHMLLYLLDLTRALGARRDIARATHLIYDLQPTDVRRYETMNRLSCSLDEWDLVREIKNNVKQLNELTGTGVTCAELRKISSSGKHVEICLSMRLSTALDPRTSMIQGPPAPLPDEIFLWERGVELRPGGLMSKSELGRLKSWMTRRLSYGDIWILPDDPSLQPHAELICSATDQLRRVLLTPTDPTDVQNVLCFVGSIDAEVVKSRVDYVRHGVTSLVARARDRIRSSMMSSGWITMSLFVVVDVGPGVGLTTLRQIADEEMMDQMLLAAFVGVDAQKQWPTCAVLHLEVKLPRVDILNSCFD